MSRANARRKGARFYMGVICNKGHDGRRYVSSGRCVTCESLHAVEEAREAREARARGPMSWGTAIKLVPRARYYVDSHVYDPPAGPVCAHDVVRSVRYPQRCRVCEAAARRAAKRAKKPVGRTIDPFEI